MKMKCILQDRRYMAEILPIRKPETINIVQDRIFKELRNDKRNWLHENYCSYHLQQLLLCF